MGGRVQGWIHEGSGMETVKVEDIQKKLREEYCKVMRNWETGKLYYRTINYVKTYTRGIFNSKAKNYIVAVIALARLGMPITTNSIRWLTNSSDQCAYSRAEHLSSLNILEPVEYGKARGSPRMFKIVPEYLTSIYSHIEGEGKC